MPSNSSYIFFTPKHVMDTHQNCITEMNTQGAKLIINPCPAE